MLEVNNNIYLQTTTIFLNYVELSQLTFKVGFYTELLYQPIQFKNLTAAITFKVFAGDTFVNYLDQEYIHQYQNKEPAVESHYNNCRKSLQ